MGDMFNQNTCVIYIDSSANIYINIKLVVKLLHCDRMWVSESYILK